jgi:hypothetical protein
LDTSKFIADLGNCHRSDYLLKGELLQVEASEELGAFRRKTLALIGAHVWHTDVAQKLRRLKRDENLAPLKAVIADPSTGNS